MLHQIKPPYLGAAYYPEVWPLANVDGDIEKMKEAGCNVMRIGEFAWGSMEPEEGRYTFEWLHTVVDKLTEADIAVVMCTPTATPPQWLTDKYEDVLAMNQNGKRLFHGARRHTCPNSVTSREMNRRIVTALAKEFGKKKGVIGWQIDNELFAYNGGCFCPVCTARFREWLKAKYQTVEALNKAWGMARWSLSYRSFDSILTPKRDMWVHPSLHYAWEQFMSDSYVEFAHEQADILHEYTDVPVGTDMMPQLSLDYTDMHRKLDVVQYNHYEDEYSAQRIPFMLDYVRSVIDRPFWVMETQTCWNGSVATNGGARPEGYCRMNSWLALALGGEMNMYWHWKAHPNGHELAHGSVLSAAGRFMHSIHEIQQLSEEFEKAADFLSRTKTGGNGTALVVSAQAHNMFKYAPLSTVGEARKNFYYADRIREDFYEPLTQKNHIGLDIIEISHDLTPYRVLFTPYLVSFEKADFAVRMKEWVENGGTWIVGPLSDLFDEHLSRYTHAPFGLLEELAGIYCTYQLPVDTLCGAAEWFDGEAAEGGVNFDGFEITGKETKSLIEYTEGFLKGLSACVEAKLGKGRIVVLGTTLKGKSFDRLVSYLELENVGASDNVIVVRRKGESECGVILAELRNRPGYAVLDGDYTDVLTGGTVSGRVEMGAYDVRVFRMK